MFKRSKYLLVFFVMVLSACNTISPTIQQTPPTMPLQEPSATVTSQPQVTATMEATATEVPTQLPTVTPTPVPVTPTIDSLSATEIAMMGTMGTLSNISQYFNPVGAPVKTWREVPIMPEATAGQEYPPYIYSYTANATLSQAQQFYSPLVASLGIQNPPATGSAGTGNKANHSVTFYSYSVTMVLTSLDNDTGHVIVVISKLP